MGADDLLVGLLKEGTGVGGHVLADSGLTLPGVRGAVDATRPPGGPPMTAMGKLPQEPEAKDAVAAALVAAGGLGHDYVGTEHLLLGVLAADNSAGAVLARLGVSPDAVRAKVIELVGADMGKGESPADAAPGPVASTWRLEVNEVRPGGIWASHGMGAAREGPTADEIAVEVMRAILDLEGVSCAANAGQSVAARAYAVADAMVAERETRAAARRAESLEGVKDLAAEAPPDDACTWCDGTGKAPRRGGY